MAIVFTDQVEFNRLEALSLRLQQLASTPATPIEGLLWTDTALHRMRYHDGTTVESVAYLSDVAGAGGGDMVAATYDPQAIADDAFDLGVMTGTMTADKISNLAAAVALLDAATLGGGITAAQLRDRATHTGQIPSSVVSDFSAAVQAVVNTYLDVDAANDAYDTVLEIANELANLIAEDASLAASIAAKTDQHSELVGDGVATSIAVTHSLGNQYPDVTVWRVSDGVKVDSTCIATDANTTTVEFAVAPTTDQYRVVVTG